MTQFVCIGVPYWLGDRQFPSAVDKIKESGLHQEIGAEWIDIQPDFPAHEDKVVAVNQALAKVLAEHAQQFPLVFVGDCTSALGMMKGLENQYPAIVWYDGHGDFNTNDTTPSGFLGGMPLAFLTGRDNQHFMQAMDLAPVADEKVILIDARNLDPGEQENVTNSNIMHLPTVAAVNTYDFGGQNLYIHFDTDVIDSAELPATSYPEPDGPSVAEAIDSLKSVIQKGQVIAILFTLWNESLDGHEVAMEQTLKIIRAFVQTIEA